MTLGEINTYVRDLLNEQSNQGRFDDAQIARAITQSTRDVALAVRFPEYQLVTTTPTTPTVQEYQLLDIVSIKRVYLNNQPLIQTSIPTLEGNQILKFDQTAATYVSQWTIAGVATYPVSSDSGWPVPIASPYYPGMRPSYYLRGASVLGIVPAPVGGAQIRVEGIAFPPPYTDMRQVTIYPHHYLETLAQGAVKRCMQSDKDSEGYQTASAAYKEARGELMDWLNSFLTLAPVVPVTYRSMYDSCDYGHGYYRGNRP